MQSLPYYPFGNPGTQTLGDSFNKISGYLKPNDSRYDWGDPENADTYQVFFNDKNIRSTRSVQYVPSSKGRIYATIAVYPGFAGALVDSEADGSVLEFDFVRYYEEIGVSNDGSNTYAVANAELQSAVAAANELLANAVTGTETGMYSEKSKTDLQNAIQQANNTTNNADKSSAAVALNEAIETFKNSQIGDRNGLKNAVSAAESLLASTSAGTGYGQCPQGYYRNLDTAISRSKELINSSAPSQIQLDNQLNLLKRAMDTLSINVITTGPVTANHLTIDIANVLTSSGGTLRFEEGVNNTELKMPSSITGELNLTFVKSPTTAVLNILQGRTVTAGSYNVSWSKAAVSGYNTVNTISFGNIPVTNGLAKVTLNKEAADKVLSNGAEITTKLSENSYEAAEALYTGGDFTAIYEGSTSVTIYTNKLGKYEIRSESTVTPTPTPTPGGGNGNGSGNWTPGVIVPPNSNTNKVKFTDIAGHWAENEIRELAKEGIINGRSETEFVPEDTMTRAEYAALIRRAIGLNPSIYSGGFNDVEGNAWYANEIQAIVNAGIMSGDADGSFRPNAPISREEMAKVIVNAYLAKSGAADVTAAEISFTDSGEIAPWAQEYIGKAAALGLINGMGDGSYAPKGNMTRAQGSVVIYRLIK